MTPIAPDEWPDWLEEWFEVAFFGETPAGDIYPVQILGCTTHHPDGDFEQLR